MKAVLAAFFLCFLAGTLADRIFLKKTWMLAHEDGHPLSLMTFGFDGQIAPPIRFKQLERTQYLATTFWNQFYVLLQDFSNPQVSAGVRLAKIFPQNLN